MSRFDSQSVYKPWLLRFYDWYILSFSNRCAWRCPKSVVMALYTKYVTAKHLEAGVGSGYFLDYCQWPRDPDITLLDLNQDCLNYTAQRIARYHPQTVQADLLQPLANTLGPFQSIGLNYVLHCVQGDLKQKAVVFDHLNAVLAPGGTLFGATILNIGVSHNFLSRKLISIYNQQGIFGNLNDSLEDLKVELARRFANVNVTVQGSVALFTGMKSG